MKITIKGNIYVANYAQKTLLENELFGQFSDGRWENSRNESWKFWCNCEVKIGEVGEVGYEKLTNYYGEKPYTTNDTELLSYIGTRMLGQAKVANYFETSLTQDEAYNIEYIVGCGNTDEYKVITEADIDAARDRLVRYAKDDNSRGYWVERVEKFDVFIDKFTSITKEELLKAFNSSYNKKDLRKDLRGIDASLRNEIK